MVGISARILLVGVTFTFLASAAAQTGAWTPPVALSTGGQGWESAAAIDGNGNSVGVWLEITTSDQIWSRSRPSGGNFGLVTVVSPVNAGTVPNLPAVRTSTAGFATAVWSDQSGVSTADRPPASNWTAPQLLIRGASSPIFVMNSQGTAAIAWNAGNSVMVMLRPTGGTWTAPQVVASGNVSANHAGISDDGAVVVTWDAFSVVCVRNRCHRTNFVLHASRQNPGTAVWADSGPLLRPDSASHDARVALDSVGEAILVVLHSGTFISGTQGSSGGAWSSFNTAVNPNATALVSGLESDGAGQVTLVYEAIPFNIGGTAQAVAANGSISSNTWSLPVVPSGSDAGVSLVQFALAPSGAAVTAWGTSTSTTSEIHAVTRATATGAWSSPVTVASAPSSQFSSSALSPEAAAVNSVGNAIVTYSDGAQSPTEFVTNFQP